MVQSFVIVVTIDVVLVVLATIDVANYFLMNDKNIILLI